MRPVRDDTYIEQIRERCRDLLKARLWTADTPAMRPNTWLNNFDEDERALVAALLDCFVFLPETHADSLLRRAFRKLISARFADGTYATLADARVWLSQVVFTPIEGERPKPVDSGNAMCRKLRQLLVLRDDQFQRPDAALESFALGRPLVFVDDFIGSGDQLCATWDRRRRADSPRSFSEANQPKVASAHALCLAVTEKGLVRTRGLSNGPDLFAAHVLTDRDTFRGAISRIPSHPAGTALEARLEALLRKYAPELALETYMKRNDYNVLGYHRLSLIFAFWNSVPDATLPLLWARAHDNWTPFIPRA